MTLDEIADARRAGLSFHAWSLDAPAADDAGSASLGELLGEEDPRVQHTLDMTALAAHWKERPRRQQRILLLTLAKAPAFTGSYRNPASWRNGAAQPPLPALPG